MTMVINLPDEFLSCLRVSLFRLLFRLLGGVGGGSREASPYPDYLREK